MIANLIVSPNTLTVYDELCWLTGLQNQEVFGLKQRLMVCVLWVTEWSVSNVATRILIGTYKFRAANKTLPSLRIFVSRNPWYPAEPSLRNSDVSNEVLHRVRQQRNILHTAQRRKANWIGHTLRTNCFLKHVRRKSRRKDRGDGKTKKQT